MQFGAFIEKGPTDWEILQQANGFTDVSISGTWNPSPENVDGKGDVFARILKEDTSDVILAWTKAVSVGDHLWEVVLDKIPTGGTYRLETCLMEKDRQGIERLRRGDMIHHLGVGDLYIIAGQSNSSGYGRGCIFDPPEIGVHLLRNSGRWDLATHPMNESTKTIHNENTETGNPGHSPYLSFAKMLKRELGYPIGLIQASKGGSSINRWNPSEVGDLYECMLNIIKLQGGKIKGILWYQGASEAISRNSAGYLDRFENMVVTLRRTLNMSELPFLTVQQNRHTDAKPVSDDIYWGMIREAQRQAAKKIPQVFVIPANDCRLSDGIHNSASSNMVIGERLAKLALCGIYHKIKSYGAPNIIKAERAENKCIKLTFENVNSGMMCYHVAPDKLPITVEDNTGLINIAEYRVESNTIILELEREGLSGLLVHGAFGANPSAFIPMDTDSQLPMLSFYNVVVE